MEKNNNSSLAKAKRSQFLAESLESRILYSGSPSPVEGSVFDTMEDTLIGEQRDFSFRSVNQFDQAIPPVKSQQSEALPSVTLLNFQNLSELEVDSLYDEPEPVGVNRFESYSDLPVEALSAVAEIELPIDLLPVVIEFDQVA